MMKKRKPAGIGREDALSLFREDIYTLAEQATAMKRAVLGSRADYACFIIDRNINFTNICSARCNFCAFYRDGDDPEAFTLSLDQILEKVGELQRLGGTQVMIQGGARGASTAQGTPGEQAGTCPPVQTWLRGYSRDQTQSGGWSCATGSPRSSSAQYRRRSNRG